MFKTQVARFAPGQVVRHRRFGYRGIIFDVDASFSQSPEWHEAMSDLSDTKSRPWYHVLVDGEKHSTYVAEDNLVASNETDEFEHPLFEHLFRCSDSGDISSRVLMN